MRRFLDKIFKVEKTNYQAILVLTAIAYGNRDVRLLDKAIAKWLEYIRYEPVSEKEENEIYDWITKLAKILVELDADKIRNNKELVLVLLKWAFSVRGDGEIDALAKAGLYLQWLFPLEKDPQNKKLNYIAETTVKDKIEKPDDLKLIIKGLFRAVRVSEMRVLRPAARYLGALVRACNLEDKKKEFKKLTAEIMNLPVTPANDKIKAELCNSIRDFNDKSLVDVILSAMKKIVDSNDTREAHLFFRKAHPALNALLGDIYKPKEHFRRRKPRMIYYKELYEGWLAEIKKLRAKNAQTTPNK